MDDEKIEYEVPDNPNLTYTVVKKKDNNPRPSEDESNETYEMIQYKEDMIDESIENLKNVEDLNERAQYKKVLEEKYGIEIGNNTVGLDEESVRLYNETSSEEFGATSSIVCILLGLVFGVIGVLVSYLVYRNKTSTNKHILFSLIGLVVWFVIFAIIMYMMPDLMVL